MTTKLVRLLIVALAIPVVAHSSVAEEIIIEDFESGNYDGWSITGDAFGQRPARGTLPRQMEVSGYRGSYLVNSFIDGDKSTGTATSPEFTVSKPHLAFLIGGGPHEGKTGIDLIINGKTVRSATGHESEVLEWSSWDVSEFSGQTARLRIYDLHTEGWGHINVDQIILTDKVPERFDLDFHIAGYRASEQYMNESLRPQYHFSPEINWMNDPNGLVFHDGEYHLFHQYNPAGNSWGHMSWGHAVSTDLVHWKHLPLAIPEVDGMMAFSGCCVVDHANSSGFGINDQPPMVAIYTGHGKGKQVQNIAFSNDHGRTWTLYKSNPVLDINQKDFRDPKVFWHKQTNRWVMVVSLAVEKVLVFYTSDDLKEWKEVSRFGPAGVDSKPNWECPDIFELPVDNEDGKTLWVLEADMGSGSIAGGSGGEYFVGRFDGTQFEKIQDAKWVDFGRDFYAPISWSDIPESDGRRIWLGWFNNWETCLVPTSPWRSCMSVPRTLSPRAIPSGKNGTTEYVMIQRPVKELQGLVVDSRRLNTKDAAWPPVTVVKSGDLDDTVFEIDTVLTPGTARSVGLRIRTKEDEYTEIGYDRKHNSVYVDRTRSGNVEFHPAFAGRHNAPTRVINGAVKLRILVDRSTIEVFINDGEAVISDRIFPTSQQPSIEVFAGDDSASLEATLHVLKSIWK